MISLSQAQDTRVSLVPLTSFKPKVNVHGDVKFAGKANQVAFDL